MKKWMKILGLLGLVAIGAAFYVYHFIYNKPHPDYKNLPAAFSTTAPALFEAFKTNPKQAAQQYNGQILLVSGQLSRIEIVDSTVISYYVLDEGMFGDEGIRISMIDESPAMLEGMVGNQTSIKAFCTGFNDTDVILEFGSIQQ